jgi:hypothetical protein
MPFGSSQWMYSSGFYPTVIDQSLMFDGTAYLSRTPSVAGDRKTWTWSGWVKRGALGTNSRTLFSAGTNGSSARGVIDFNDTNTLRFGFNDGSTWYIAETTAVFRDPSAWYHIVVKCDLSNATQSSRAALYVNGVQQTTDSVAWPDADQVFNNTVFHGVGRNYGDGTYYFDGYQADTYLVDGTALDPTSFGEFKNGVWIPKAYTGSYGTNGFHLEYDGNPNDSSGTGNNWTATNIVAGDYMLDSPTNNYATLNPLATSLTLSEGNLKASGGSAHNAAKSTMAISTGMKVYVEVTFGAAPNGGWFGLTPRGDNETAFTSTDRTGLYSTTASSTFYGSGSGTNVGGPLLNNGNTWGMAVDFDNGRAYFCKITAGTPTWYARNGSNGSQYAPDGASDNLFGFNNSDTTLPLFVLVTQDSTPTLNFGQTGYQNNSVPDGFLALSTANLPEPSISPLYGASPQDHFNTVLYTGTGAALSITDVGFQPDLVWSKARNTGTPWHQLTDSVRGTTKQLFSNEADAEDTNADKLTSFDSDGFTLGSNGGINGSGDTFVAWNWKASNATAVSNTSGSITSQVSANTTAGFSIVSYTGTGANATVGHGLDSAPDMVIVKRRSAVGAWVVYHSANTSAPATDYLELNTTIATADAAVVWNDTEPTSSVFSIGTADALNANTATFIAYCFNSVEGYSKFGSYTGNGSADGTFVYTGFRPAWVMVKRTNNTGNWQILDTKRSSFNVSNANLYANLSNAEVNGGNEDMDILSNGWKPRNASASFNVNGGTYIYMAFAENPFKYSVAR